MADGDRSGGSPQRWLGSRVSAVAAALLAAAPLAWPAPTAAQSRAERFGQRYRSLDATERGRAIAAAREPSEAEIRRRTGRVADAPLRVELLAVEPETLAKDARPETYRRRAEVSLYDYDTDRRSIALVDLESGQVESIAVVTGGQLPLTPAEVARAYALALADPETSARLRADYARITSQPLRDPGQLKVIGFVYRADSMPDRNAPETEKCGVHRCAQLLVRTPDDVALDLPIVDLSRERVLESRSFAPSQPPAAPVPATPATPASAAAAAPATPIHRGPHAH